MEESFLAVVAEVLEMDPKDVTPDMTPESVDSWDSMNHLRLITAVEEQYGVHFSMTEVQALDSIGSLSDLVQRHRETG